MMQSNQTLLYSIISFSRQRFIFQVLYNFLKKREEVDLDFDSEEVEAAFTLFRNFNKKKQK